MLLAITMAFSACSKTPATKNQEQNQINNQQQQTNGAGEIDMNDWQTYRNEEYGFEIKYPEDWKIYQEIGSDNKIEPLVLKKINNNACFLIIWSTDAILGKPFNEEFEKKENILINEKIKATKSIYKSTEKNDNTKFSYIEFKDKDNYFTIYSSINVCPKVINSAIKTFNFFE